MAERPLRRGEAALEAHLALCPECARLAAALAAADAALAPRPDAAPPIPSFAAISSAAASVALGHRRRRLARRAFPFALTGAIAAGVVLLVLAGRGSHPTGPANAPNAPLFAAPGTSFDATAGAQGRVLRNGARVHADSGVIAVVAGEQTDGLRLEGGSVTLEVPRLPEGHLLFVATPDAEVRVHGTRFTVARDAAGTAVKVTEGVVEVRPQGAGRQPVMLRAGDATFVEPLGSYRIRARAEALTALDQGQVSVAEGHLGSLLATEPEPPMAAEARALLAWASASRGDRAGAIVLYRRALAELPLSERPLWADNASAELALLLEQADAGAAVSAWRAYLERFPGGVHADLARKHLGAAER